MDELHVVYSAYFGGIALADIPGLPFGYPGWKSVWSLLATGFEPEPVPRGLYIVLHVVRR